MNLKEATKHPDYPFSDIKPGIKLTIDPIQSLKKLFKLNKGTAKVLLYILQKNISNNNFVYLSPREAASRTNQTDRNVRKAISMLLDKDLIALSNKNNVFYLNPNINQNKYFIVVL
jgi:DNA-binding MarR family transcriptional regulator